MRIILEEAPNVIQSEGIEALLVDQCPPAEGTVADFLNIPFISLCNALPLNREISVPPMFTSWQYSSTWSAKLRNQVGYALSNVLTRSIRKLTAEYRQQWKLPPPSHLNNNYSNVSSG